MPPLPPVAKVIRTAINGSLQGSPTALIQHWLYSGSQGAPSDMDNFASAVLLSYKAAVLPHHNSDYSIITVTAVDLTSSVAPSGEFTQINAGGVTSAGTNAQTCCVISHKIARRYRGGHPRSYLGGFSASDLQDQRTWSNTFLSTIFTAWSTYITDVQTSGITPMAPYTAYSVSYRSGNAPRVTPVLDVIFASEPQPRLCTQRRRLGPLLVE